MKATEVKPATGAFEKLAAARENLLLSFYRRAAMLIIDALIIAVLFTVLIGTGKVFTGIYAALTTSSLDKIFHGVLNDVMVVLIFIELFRVLIEYSREERVKLTYIVDATIVMILKEIWVRVTEKGTAPIEALVLVGMLLAVGVIRVAAVWRSPSRVTDGSPEG